MSLRKILVPTDLSACSTRALAEAQLFAAAFGASIDLMYVWSAPTVVAPEAVITGVGVNEQPLLAWIRNNASEQLGRFEAAAQQAGIAVRSSICESGDPATAIVERAASGGYDLLVLGTHGRTGLSHLLVGSVAEKVMRRAPCPVLTVRDTAIPA
jgi:universal stress protein A